MQYELPETIGARLASSLLCTINSIVSQTPMITISIALKPLYSLNKVSHLMAGPLLNQDIQLHFSRAASDKNNPSRLPYWIPSNAGYHLAAESFRGMLSEGTVTLRWRVRCMAVLESALGSKRNLLGMAYRSKRQVNIQIRPIVKDYRWSQNVEDCKIVATLNQENHDYEKAGSSSSISIQTQ